MLKTSRFKGIQSRLLLLIMIVLVPVLVVEIVIFSRHFEDRKAEELQANLEMARAVARTFDAFVTDICRTQVASGLAATSSPPLSRDSLLKVLR